MQRMIVAAGMLLAAVAHPVRAQTVSVTPALDTIPWPTASHYASGLSGATSVGYEVTVVCPTGGAGRPCDLSLSFGGAMILPAMRWTITGVSGNPVGCVSHVSSMDNQLTGGQSIAVIGGSGNVNNRTCIYAIIFKVGGLSWTTHTASLTPYDQAIHFKACKRSVAATPCTPP